MIRRYGLALGGTRCQETAPADHLADADLHCRLEGRSTHSTLVLESGHKWRRVQRILSLAVGPTLKPGDSVICDNLRTHKVADVKELIEAGGATIKVLPPL